MPSPYPPSGITRNYGVDFFIFSSPTYPMQMAASNSSALAPGNSQYVPFPSPGLIAYFDWVLGAAPFSGYIKWDDCISDAFVADADGTGGPIVFPGM